MMTFAERRSIGWTTAFVAPLIGYWFWLAIFHADALFSEGGVRLARLATVPAFVTSIDDAFQFLFVSVVISQLAGAVPAFVGGTICAHLVDTERLRPRDVAFVVAVSVAVTVLTPPVFFASGTSLRMAGILLLAFAPASIGGGLGAFLWIRWRRRRCAAARLAAPGARRSAS